MMVHEESASTEDELTQLARFFESVLHSSEQNVNEAKLHLMGYNQTISASQLEIKELLRKFTFWQTVVQLILVAIALIGNGIICLSSRYLRRPISLYVLLCVSLAAIDIWASTIFVIDQFANHFFRSRLNRLVNFSACPFHIISIFRVSATISSSWHLLALAVYQYFGIMWPLRTKIGVRRKHFRFLFIFLWITPMIILFAKYSIDPKDGLLAEKCVSHFRDRFSHRIFVAGLVLVPLIVTISLYIRIVCYLRGSYSMIKTKNWTQITENSVENFPKLVNTAVVIVISFIVGYGIHSIHSPLICKEGCPFRHGKTWIIWLGFLQSDLVILKFVANPFIYTLRMSCFRESISSMSQSFSTALTRMRGSSFQQMPKQESIRMGQL